MARAVSDVVQSVKKNKEKTAIIAVCADSEEMLQQALSRVMWLSTYPKQYTPYANGTIRLLAFTVLNPIEFCVLIRR